MKNSILWLASSVLAIFITVGGYAAIRGKLKSDDAGSPSSGAENRPSAHGDAVATTGKETGISRGIASFYGVSTNGTRTASGVLLNDSKSTAAHRTLPFGTLVRVTNLSNGLSETVEITDRGPFVKGRIIDVSHNAAGKLDMIRAGVVSVEIEVLSEGKSPPRPALAGD